MHVHIGPAPRLAQVVVYRARTRGYALAAVVTATQASLDPEGVRLGHVPALSDDDHVHLHVLTPGAQQSYQEHNVPHDEGGAPGTWAWAPVETGRPS